MIHWTVNDAAVMKFFPIVNAKGKSRKVASVQHKLLVDIFSCSQRFYLRGFITIVNIYSPNQKYLNDIYYNVRITRGPTDIIMLFFSLSEQFDTMWYNKLRQRCHVEGVGRYRHFVLNLVKSMWSLWRIRKCMWFYTSCLCYIKRNM